MTEKITTTEDLDALTDELSGWPIGIGYYQTSVSYAEAREMADAVLAWFAARQPATVSAETVQIIASESGRPESVVRDWLRVAGIEVRDV